MSESPNFTFSLHGAPMRVVASTETTGLILEFARRHGPSVIIYTDDHELTRKLADAWNSVLEAHRASPAAPMSEAAE